MGAINEILPKATGVGKVDPNSGGTGEIFNSYEDYKANKATGEYSHAEGCYNEAKGNYSHAEGYSTIASGNNAHAEGDCARANGYCSHAEGNSLANGRHSHAEGYSNSAMGDSSHAEGGQSDANGEYSHAEGFRTKTFSFAEHAEGTYNKSYDSEVDSTRVIHSVGIGSQENNRKNAHEIKFNGDHYVYGIGGYDGTETTGAQTLQEVINELASGVGKVDSNSDGTGEIFNTYEGPYANAATGKYSHAEGNQTKATGFYSHAEGDRTIASGTSSHAEGSDTTATGNASHAEGYLTRTESDYCHAEGYRTTASGDHSHAEGNQTKATAWSSHAEGDQTTASGGYSHAEGYYSSASGLYSHAEGRETTASGESSHAEGRETTASGASSHAEGSHTSASGYTSHAEGYYTNALNPYEHAEGRYNISNSGSTDELKTRHSVGIGNSQTDRKNAHEIMANGDHYIYGLGGYDGTNATAETSQTLQAVINSLSTITVDYNQPTTSYTGSDSTTIYKIFDLSSLKYTEGNDIILINGAQRLKYQYAYGETQAATVQVNESTSIEYNLINILSPLITNIFSLEKLTIVHGKINAETDEKYYLIIEAVPTV